MTHSSPQAEQLVHAVLRMRKANFSAFFCSMTRAEFFTAEYIHAYAARHPDEPGVSVSELAALLRIRPPAVSRTIRPLELRGLLKRSEDPQDRRNTRLSLTPEGEAVRAEICARMQRFSAVFAERMSAQELETLVRLLNKTMDIWDEQLRKETSEC